VTSGAVDRPFVALVEDNTSLCVMVMDVGLPDADRQAGFSAGGDDPLLRLEVDDVASRHRVDFRGHALLRRQSRQCAHLRSLLASVVCVGAPERCSSSSGPTATPTVTDTVTGEASQQVIYIEVRGLHRGISDQRCTRPRPYGRERNVSGSAIRACV
jgi:hypothetical protein